MPIKTSYILEMTSPEDLNPKTANLPDILIEKMEPSYPEFNKFLHTAVGYEYKWGGRTTWGEKEWNAYVNREELETWVMYKKGTPAGYFELAKRANGDIQIECFGLLLQFVGKGLGGILLTKTIQRAWEIVESALPA